jgi:uncharacterized membrane protein YccF (DUF307 family)
MEKASERATRHCTICGAASSADATFCRSCGQVLEVPRSPIGVIYCERCGGELNLGDSYCPTCGEPQSKGGLVKASPASAPATQSTSLSTPLSLSDDTVVEQVDRAPSLLVRVIWLLFVGPALGMVVSMLAWLAVVTVVAAPVGFQLLEQLPFLVTLKPTGKRIRLHRQSDGTLVASEERMEQLPVRTRAIYFGIVGWLVALIWLCVAWAAAWTLIGFPVATWMVDRLPFLTTLDQG